MSEITERDIHVFVDAVSNFFLQTTRERAEIRSAYLALGAEPPVFDFTGAIQISGGYRGCIYFSAPRRLLTKWLLAVRDPYLNEENLLDAVGEIANTISGNAREHFGQTLEISVPARNAGAQLPFTLGPMARPFVIMLRWREHEAAVVVAVERLATNAGPGKRDA